MIQYDGEKFYDEPFDGRVKCAAAELTKCWAKYRGYCLAEDEQCEYQTLYKDNPEVFGSN